MVLLAGPVAPAPEDSGGSSKKVLLLSSFVDEYNFLDAHTAKSNVHCEPLSLIYAILVMSSELKQFPSRTLKD